MKAATDRTSPLIIPAGLPKDTKDVLAAIMTIWGSNQPTLRQMWAAMDLVWDNYELNNYSPDPEALAAFYSHPVWLMNGLFVEHHSESLKHRETFSDWIAEQCPTRVADLGGGYGTLGRLIARKCPDTKVDIIEPYPASLAVEASRDYKNVIFETSLSGEYDIMVATDVFEHLVDPLEVLFSVAPHVKIGGYMIPANCFAPVIKCHLPTSFHFDLSWPLFMALAGFEPAGEIAYAQVFRKVRQGSITPAVRRWERLSRKAWSVGRNNRHIVRGLRIGLPVVSRWLL